MNGVVAQLRTMLILWFLLAVGVATVDLDNGMIFFQRRDANADRIHHRHALIMTINGETE